MDCGEDLLLRKYSSVGPEAVRQEYLTRSILDEAMAKNSLEASIINRASKPDKGLTQIKTST